MYNANLPSNGKAITNLFSRWMLVVYFDPAKIDLLIFMFPVKAGVEIVDNKMFAFASLRFVKRHYQ